jgi:subtilisin family serine protease
MKNFKFLKTTVVTAALAVFSLSTVAFSDALIDPSLKAFAQSETNIAVKVLVLVKGVQSNLHPKRYDRSSVISYYKDTARLSAQPLLVSYQNKELEGVRFVSLYWINGALLAYVTPQGLRNLSHQPTVTKIYNNKKMGFEPGLGAKAPRRRTIDNVKQDYAFGSIGLDKLIKEQPQVDGKGVLVGVVDTGVDASHPALAGKVPLFYNGEEKKVGEPKDFDTHGTHVSGTIAGGDRSSNLIGIAPGAKIVMAGVVEQGYDAMIDGMQWFLDAEKNPIVANKIRSVGCSWNSGGAPDQEVFYRAIAAWEAAGILPVFSAGNNGDQGITNPHEYPGTFAVAAYGADGKVADFSSRGPGHYKGQDTQKPDIAAPGVDITSSVPGGKYEEMSGTSMAQPHVTGTTALLLQVKPDLNPAQLREVLVKSAVAGDGQTAGQWTPDYGFGKLNAYNAVKMVSSLSFDMNTSQFLNRMVFDAAGPRALDTQSFSAASLGEVGSEVDQFTDTDTSAWLTTAQVYAE